MKETAVFILIGRGVAVDEDALVQALQGGVIKGAALGAFAPAFASCQWCCWRCHSWVHCSPR